MDVLGVRIDLLLFFQILTTVVVLGLFSAYQAYRFPIGERLSDLQTAILVQLVTDNDPNFSDLEKIVERPLTDLNWGLWVWHSEKLNHLLVSRKFEDEESYGRGSLTEALGGVFMGPLAIFFALGVWLDHRKARLERLLTTPSRRVNMAQAFVIIAGSFGYMVVALWFTEMVTWLRYLLGIGGALGVLGGLAFGGMVVFSQLEWKMFFRHRLLELIIIGERKKNTDLVTQAMLAHAEIERAPSIPFPVALGFYVSSFSVIQATLIWLDRNTAWL